MATLALDTQALVKELTAAGFSEGQAEAVTSAVRRSREADLAELTTKGDLALLEKSLKAKIEAIRADLLKWVVGMVGFQTLVIFGALAGLALWLASAR